MPTAAGRLVQSLRWLLGLVAAGLVLFSFLWVITRPLRQQARRGDQIELRILHWGDKQEDQIVAGLVAAFEAQNHDIRVIRTNTGSPAQLATKLQTMLASGDPPDLFYLPFEKVAAIASKDVLEDVEPYVQRDRAAGIDAPDLEDFFPATLAAFRYDPRTRSVGGGTLVGLPKDFTCVGFYYNKKLFDQAGVPYPPDDWTWDQFIDAARKIGKLNGCYGAEVVTWESMVRIVLYTHGLDVTEPGWQSFHLTDPAVIAVLDQLRSWFHDESRTLLSAKTQLETGQAPFLSGKIGMAGPFGRWQVPLYRGITDFDWDFAPLPHAAGKAPSNGVLTVAWAMAKRSRHKAESWRLMKFLLGREGQEIVARTGLAIPVLKSVAAGPEFSDPAAKPERDDVFLRGAMVAQPVEWPSDPRFMDELKSGFESIYKLGQPTRESLARVDASWQKIAQFTAAKPRMPWGAIGMWAGLGLTPLVLFGAARWWLRRPGRLERREELAGLAMISPWSIGFVAFCAFPIVLSLLLGFTRWNAMLTLDQAEWVGIDNFREAITFDPKFQKAVLITAWYALLAVPSSQIVALLAAMLMNREMRGIYTFRAIWYLPSVLAGVGMAILWKWVFHHEYGLLNALLTPICDAWNHFVGSGGHALAPPRWFEKDAERWGVPAFALINLWLIGGTMMIYLAGLRGIPAELYEAADIDGAGGWRRFRNVTLPMLSPVIFFNSIMAVIASFQIFTQVFVMTGGGPGDATNFYVFYLYKNAFDLGAMGYASAMAWILLVIVLALTLLIMKGTQRMVYYEGLKA
ncbi:MAG: extracellular solute-binding protein [Phycisphaerae bacterium]